MRKFLLSSWNISNPIRCHGRDVGGNGIRGSCAWALLKTWHDSHFSIFCRISLLMPGQNMLSRARRSVPYIPMCPTCKSSSILFLMTYGMRTLLLLNKRPSSSVISSLYWKYGRQLSEQSFLANGQPFRIYSIRDYDVLSSRVAVCKDYICFGDIDEHWVLMSS